MTIPETDNVFSTSEGRPHREPFAAGGATSRHTSYFAKVVWTPEDIVSTFEMTLAEAEEWLSNNERHICDAMVQAGWTAIETCGAMDGLKPVKEEDTELPKGEGWGECFLAG